MRVRQGSQSSQRCASLPYSVCLVVADLFFLLVYQTFTPGLSPGRGLISAAGSKDSNEVASVGTPRMKCCLGVVGSLFWPLIDSPAQCSMRDRNRADAATFWPSFVISETKFLRDEPNTSSTEISKALLSSFSPPVFCEIFGGEEYHHGLHRPDSIIFHTKVAL